MKIEIKANNKIFGIEIDVKLLKYKFKKFVKNLLGALSVVSLFLLCTMEIKQETSPLMTLIIYFSLLAVFTIGMIVNND